MDEADLIFDWATYHASLFGRHNIHIIDNNSHHPQSVAALQALRLAGFDIRFFDVLFQQKSSVLSQIMLAYSNLAEEIVLLPLDADEFVVALPHRSFSLFSTARDDILATFSRLSRDGRKMKLTSIEALACDSFSSTEPHHFRRVLELTHFIVSTDPSVSGCLRKTFYWGDGFLSIDQGSHVGHVKQDDGLSCSDETRCMECYQETDLGIVHFAPTFYEHHKRKYLRGALAYNHTGIVDASGECGGYGEHYCWFYRDLQQLGEDEVRRRYCQDLAQKCASAVPMNEFRIFT